MRKETFNKIINAVAFIFFMLLDFKSFAQLPGDDSDNGDLEDGDPVPAVSIDSPKIIILLILGILFIYLHYKKIYTIKKIDL